MGKVSECIAWSSAPTIRPTTSLAWSKIPQGLHKNISISIFQPPIPAHQRTWVAMICIITVLLSPLLCVNCCAGSLDAAGAAAQ